ncbi:hypothetical protein ACF08M_30145 [Streptomyces sp. NPDC015032]|uniref:hypothetical protein n=1 Tax=Streptomyces sp. NPDC015032 TaxID=3364937 RepID=UPI0036FA0F1B
MAEYQATVHAGLIVPERRPCDPSMQQMADGAKQIANGARDFFNAKVSPAAESSGARDFFNDRVAPAAQSAARSVQQSASRPGMAKLTGLAPAILAAAAFLAIISLFLPVASAMGFSANYFSDAADGEGGFLLFVMLVAIAASVAAIVNKAKWPRITAGAVGLVAGLLAMVDSFGTVISISNTRYVSVGAGVVFLALLSVVMLAAAVLVLMSLRQVPTMPAMPPAPPAQPPQS